MWIFRPSYGQELTLKISSKDSLHSIFINSIHYQKKHLSENSLFASLDSVKNRVEENGFLNYNLDTLTKNDSLYMAKFDLGRLNKKVRIFYTDKDITKEQLYNITAPVGDRYFDIPIENLSTVLNNIVAIFETEGNSFTEVSLKNISVKKEFIETYLSIKRSSRRKIDRIVINGYSDFPKSHIGHILKLKTGSRFNHDKLTDASKRIKILPFVAEIKPPEVLFTKDSTIIYLYLKKKLANKFDGLIGFTSKEIGTGISFNGYLDLSLNNIFNGGESFFLYWKNNGNQRQVFNISTQIPYIFNSRFSLRADLNIYKQDSTFINTEAKLRLPYFINERNSFGVSLQTETSSNLLTANSEENIDDFKNIFYGFNYNYKVFNQSDLFPIKFDLYSEVLNGTRQIDNLNTNQFKLYLKMNYLLSLNITNHIFLQNESSALLSEGIVTNELFRIGGVNSIRGFNEQSIFASTFSYFNVEYRLNTNNVSYLYSITDLGYIENRVANQSSQIYALGLGYAFNTNFGFLNLSYAIGGSSREAIRFDNSRFHIKVISFF